MSIAEPATLSAHTVIEARENQKALSLAKTAMLIVGASSALWILIISATGWLLR